MRNVWKARSAMLLGLVVAGLMIAGSANSASARPRYLKEFKAEYKKLADQAKTAKCKICHFGKKKKDRNDYGTAMKKHFGKKKNVKVISAAPANHW